MQQEKIIETKQCKNCNSKFDITDKDLEFYDKISPTFNKVKYSIPSPTHCPDCRQQRRLAFRNERKLYKRNCDASGKQIISIYSSDKKYKVYDSVEWKSDKWDALAYGRDFDFSKPFFEQYDELNNFVPKNAIFGSQGNENAAYNNYVGDMKDCYLVFDSMVSNNCYYGLKMSFSNDCMDCDYVINSEKCYDCIYCMKCFNLFHCDHCKNCRDSLFLYDCENCEDCIMCVGLIGKKYHIFNIEYSKQAYEDKKQQLLNQKIVQSLADFEKIKKSLPSRSLFINKCENSIGNNLDNCKDSYRCFDSFNINNCKFAYRLHNSSDCYDYESWGDKSTLIYEVIGSGSSSYKVAFGVCNWSTCNEVYYSMFLSGCNNVFGCVGLRKKQYCILNKQYTKEQYEQLVPKIIEHMKKTGEWGEFFPASISPFGYNETVAQDYFPISRDEAINIGYKRQDNEYPINILSGIETLNGKDLPENISQVDESILNKAIICEITGKPFRIIKQELEFYKKHNLPLPRRHPDQRHLDRLAKRNPRKLFDRKCDKCLTDMKTTYSPDSPEIVYCENCYNKEVF